LEKALAKLTSKDCEERGAQLSPAAGSVHGSAVGTAPQLGHPALSMDLRPQEEDLKLLGSAEGDSTCSKTRARHTRPASPILPA